MLYEVITIADGLLPRQRLREAAACARDALALDPAAVRASLLIARVAMEQERWPAAIQALKRVREQEPIFIRITSYNVCYTKLLRAYQRRPGGGEPSLPGGAGEGVGVLSFSTRKVSYNFV